MPDWWFYPVIASFLLALVFSDLGRALGQCFGIVDIPRGNRKKHKGHISTLGGAAIYVAIVISVGAVLVFSDVLTAGAMENRQFVGFFIGGLILVIGGLVDDLRELRARYSILFPILASLIAALFGIGVSKITNPLGGFFEVADALSFGITFFWLLGMSYVTKLLDGLDGLCASVSATGALILACLALSVAYFQPDAALLSLIVVAAIAGFLMWNWHPASLFLGEGGSTFLGYTIGVLAVIGGGKFATALLVVAVPLFDILFVLYDRYRAGVPLFAGDRRHLHHRLRDLGLSTRAIVLLYCGVALAFGLSTLIFSSIQKLIAIGVLFGLMLLAVYIIHVWQKKRV